MNDSNKEPEINLEDLKKQRALRIMEMKNNLKDLRVEEEYWRLLSSISESKHKMFLINLEKAQYGKDIANSTDSPKEGSSK